MVEKGDYLEELPEDVDGWHRDRSLCGVTKWYRGGYKDVGTAVYGDGPMCEQLCLLMIGIDATCLYRMVLMDAP